MPEPAPVSLNRTRGALRTESTASEESAVPVRPFPIHVPDADLEDLHRRLLATRWPEAETADAWEQGVPLAYMKEIVAYWADGYDWRHCEERISAAGSHLTEIDGLDIHFLHVRSQHETARPIVLTHGWPGSVLEFLELIPRLTDPTAHGGRADDAFHVVAPSLPGYGFSGKPARPGWGVERIADAWAVLMARLGYDRHVAQGGDWGSAVSEELLRRHAESCAAIHLNLVAAKPPKAVMKDATEEEGAALMRLAAYRTSGSGYFMQQSTRPQTLGYGLVDSPVGQAAWVLEKFREWTDCEGHPETAIERDHLLDNVTLYWLTRSGASSGRLYWESARSMEMKPVPGPVGCTIFPEEIFTPSRRWAESRYETIIHWGEVDAGGHFAAMEQPAILAEEIRTCFRDVTL